MTNTVNEDLRLEQGTLFTMKSKRGVNHVGLIVATLTEPYILVAIFPSSAEKSLNPDKVDPLIISIVNSMLFTDDTKNGRWAKEWEIIGKIHIKPRDFMPVYKLRTPEGYVLRTATGESFGVFPKEFAEQFPNEISPTPEALKTLIDQIEDGNIIEAAKPLLYHPNIIGNAAFLRINEFFKNHPSRV